jgi:DNA invertase Pin-like site-specific DNA recombinase
MRRHAKPFTQAVIRYLWHIGPRDPIRPFRLAKAESGGPETLLQNLCRSDHIDERVSQQLGALLLIGYARATDADQTLSQQTDALGRVGCKRIFSDDTECGQLGREGVADALSHLRRGDELVVFKLDRLGRSVHQLIKLVDELRRRDVGFRSLSDDIDSAASRGRFLQTMAALSEMERSLTRERTRVGLAVARVRGREGGRRPKLSLHQIEQAKSLLADRTTNVSEVAASLGVARSTLYRAIERASEPRPK